MTNVIQTENLNAGTVGWQVKNAAALGEIAGWVDHPSYSAGDTVTFYVSVKVAATTYTLQVYRMGWYDGCGGSLKHTSAPQTGVAQGYDDGTGLFNCPSAVSDGVTLRLESGWASSYTWSIPGNAVTGIYLAQFTDANGKQAYAVFVVKGNASADYAFQYSTFTDAAYNSWGGRSLYGDYAETGSQAKKVSLNRPTNQVKGAGNLFRWDLASVKWLERQGYNLSYISDLDAHTGGAATYQQYKAILFPAHSEYWSKEMRDAAETARDSGVGLCFLGGNACYWQVRLETDSASVANRTIVCYRSTGTDPLFGVDNTRVTVNWRSSPVNRPEASMIGVMYSHVILNQVCIPWTVDAGAGADTYLVGTGLVAGTSYGAEIVGTECDKQQSGSPANLKILATTNYTASDSSADTQNTAYYVAPSGAFVFGSGCIQWCFALDGYRQSGGSAPATVPGIQALMRNVMAALIACKAGSGVSTGAGRFAFHG